MHLASKFDIFRTEKKWKRNSSKKKEENATKQNAKEEEMAQILAAAELSVT
jgi:hypothetical protein